MVADASDAPGAVPGAGPGAAPGALPGAGSGAVPDVGLGAGPNAVPDAGPSAGLDASPSAGPRVGSDALPGAGLGAGSEGGNPLREPVLDLLGVRLVVREAGHAEFALAVEPRHLNFDGRLHGGLVALLLDVACGYAAMPMPDGRTATISLAINYLAGVPGGVVRAAGRTTGGGRRVVFASAELRGEDGTLVATAQGSFRVFAGSRG